MASKFYISVAKELKLRVGKFWRLHPTFVEVTGQKLVGRASLHPLPLTPHPPLTILPSWIELRAPSQVFEYLKEFFNVWIKQLKEEIEWQNITTRVTHSNIRKKQKLHFLLLFSRLLFLSPNAILLQPLFYITDLTRLITFFILISAKSICMACHMYRPIYFKMVDFHQTNSTKQATKTINRWLSEEEI